MKNNSKYVAIKVCGLESWLWFERAKTTREDGIFLGEEGLGWQGAETNISVNEDLIEGEIESDYRGE